MGFRLRPFSHLNEERLRGAALEAGSADPAVARHLASCRRCRSQMELVAAVAVELRREPSPGECPEPELLVRLARGSAIPPTQSRGLERHLRRCVDCLALLEGLKRAETMQARAPVLGAKGASAPGAGLARLRALIRFEMPAQLSFATRGKAAPPLAREALLAYREGKFALARRRLERARSTEGWNGDLAFYLGACQFRAGRFDQAVESFAEAAARSGAKIGIYRWYHALALLAVGDARQGLRELERASKLPGRERLRARALAEQVRALVDSPPE